MIEAIAEVKLPVNETLSIKKNRYEGGKRKKKKRISIITGVHGDELEGQYVCYELGRRLQEHPELLNGIVDIYPAMNPLGIDSINRGIPGFDLDMNRIFPGNKDGSMSEYVVSKIVEDLLGSDLAIDIHASNIFLEEIPQVRINELHKKKLVPLAKEINVDLIWAHSNATVLEATLAYSLNSRKTPCLVVEMGVGMRITKKYCDQLVDGIFNVMAKLGIWKGETITPREARIAAGADPVCYMNSPVPGVFVHDATIGTQLKKGDLIGRIVDPLQGTVSDYVKAPVDGWLFTVREYPIVDEGSLTARILKEGTSV
ncbi:MAG: M14 family metallopeptidase [Phascolarctobacterium sp.]|nr:M14 family metallopeptidase [Phascolarctobacterium sp.]